MASVTMKILLIFLIISVLSCRILSVLPDDVFDEYPFTCEVDQNCSVTERCNNNLCIDACTGVTCDLSRRCVHISAHAVYCMCRKVSEHSNKCVPSCHDDRDCHHTRECIPDEKNFYHCSCRSNFAPDPIFPEYECRKRCQYDTECNAGSICKTGMCFDFCNSDHCEHSHELCLNVNTAYMCVSNETLYQLYKF